MRPTEHIFNALINYLNYSKLISNIPLMNEG